MVRRLWQFLRSHGVDAKLDLSAVGRRQDGALWMANQIREADYILVIASPAYRARTQGQSDPEAGRGVQRETRLIRDAFYADQKAVNRFVPVVVPGQTVDDVPGFLAPATTTVYHVNSFTPSGTKPMLRLLFDQPFDSEPPLGQQPPLPLRPPEPSCHPATGTGGPAYTVGTDRVGRGR